LLLYVILSTLWTQLVRLLLRPTFLQTITTKKLFQSLVKSTKWTHSTSEKLVTSFLNSSNC
jgi:hypothetical protein